MTEDDITFSKKYVDGTETSSKVQRPDVSPSEPETLMRVEEERYGLGKPTRHRTLARIIRGQG